MFKMLNVGDTEWVSSLMGLGAGRRDIHWDQRMLAPYVTAYKWKAHLAFTQNEGGYIIQPILVTPEGYLRNAYNFGGPMGSSDSMNSSEHTEGIELFATKNGYISQYCTLNPCFIANQLRILSSSNITPECRKQSVIVDLFNQKVRGTTRRLANKAQTVGVTVKSYDPDLYLETFFRMYEATMDRVQASDHWNFPFNWFQSFQRFVKPRLLMAEFEGRLEAGCLIVYSQQYPIAYYHFAGTFNRLPTLGINHMLVLAACDFVKSIGIRYLYLGGGVSDKEEDSLLTFKSGFSKDRVPVYTYSISYVKEVRQVN